jgi:hypothetical protein
MTWKRYIEGLTKHAKFYVAPASERSLIAAETDLGVKKAKTCSDSQCLESCRVSPVRYGQAAIIFSFAMEMASRKVCMGVLPKHHRP